MKQEQDIIMRTMFRTKKKTTKKPPLVYDVRNKSSIEVLENKVEGSPTEELKI